MSHPKPNKHPGRGTRVISSRIAIQGNAMIKKHNGPVFWENKIVLFVNFLNCVATLTSKSYCVTLERLQQETCQSSPDLLHQGITILHDEARSFIADRTGDLWSCYWKDESHSPEPSLPSSEFNLFGLLMNNLTCKRFGKVAEV